MLPNTMNKKLLSKKVASFHIQTVTTNFELMKPIININ